MKQIINLGNLGKKPDHKMSNADMLQYCVDRVDWLTEQLFGIRDSEGKLVKTEHKDKNGNVKYVSYNKIGMLHKIEGVKEFNAETKQEEIKQPGLEQLWAQLKNNFDNLMLASQIQQAMFATVLKLSPQEYFDLTEDKNADMNRWLMNYSNILEAHQAKLDKEEKEKVEELKAAGVMPSETGEGGGEQPKVESGD